MIGLRETLTLAGTKLRTRRVRHALVTVSTGLVFGILVFGSIVAAGLLHSVKTYSDTGYGGQFFIQTSRLMDYGNFDTTNKRAQQIAKERISKIKRPAGVPAPTTFNPSEADTVQAERELNPTYNLDTVTKAVAGVPHGAIYAGNTVTGNNSDSVRVIQDGKELGADKDQAGQTTGYSSSSLTQPQLQTLSTKLLEPFVAKGQTTEVSSDGRLPVFMPLTYGLQLLKITVPKNASVEDKIALKRQARERLTGQNLDLCLRNSTALSQLQEAKNQAEDFATNGKTAGYQLPELAYNLPTTACQPITIKRDVRSAESKTLEAYQDQVEQKPAALTEVLRLRVAGFVADGAASSDSIEISSLLTTGPNGAFYIPDEQRLATPMLKQLFDPVVNASPAFYIQAANLADYRKLSDTGCSVVDASGPAKCIKDGKLFYASNFGNPTVNFQDIAKTAGKVLAVAILIVTIIAAIILMITIGKVMADSRRETGVFRAIGAARSDIAQIYLTYALALAARAFVVAFLLASVAAWWLTVQYGPAATAAAVDAFSAYDQVKPVVFFGLDWLQLLSIFSIVLVSALVACIIPLINNLGRNPIKALRDE